MPAKTRARPAGRRRYARRGVTRREAHRILSDLADRAKAEGWHSPLPPAERERAREALTALEGVLPGPARDALIAEEELRWAQVALVAAAIEARPGGE